MSEALAQQKKGQSSGHSEWIRLMLSDYYDPIYEYQLKNKTGRIVHCGNASQLANLSVQTLTSQLFHPEPVE